MSTTFFEYEPLSLRKLALAAINYARQEKKRRIDRWHHLVRLVSEYSRLKHLEAKIVHPQSTTFYPLKHGRVSLHEARKSPWCRRGKKQWEYSPELRQYNQEKHDLLVRFRQLSSEASAYQPSSRFRYPVDLKNLGRIELTKEQVDCDCHLCEDWSGCGDGTRIKSWYKVFNKDDTLRFVCHNTKYAGLVFGS